MLTTKDPSIPIFSTLEVGKRFASAGKFRTKDPQEDRLVDSRKVRVKLAMSPAASEDNETLTFDNPFCAIVGLATSRVSQKGPLKEAVREERTCV